MLPWVVGIVALALAAIGGTSESLTSARAYLLAYSFWFLLSVGCLGMAFMQFLTGGMWGLLTRRVFEAGAVTLPLMALLFVPVAVGTTALYPWVGSDDPVVQHKAIYLNAPFFIARAVVYFACWLVLVWRLRSLSLAEDTANLRRLQRLSIVGLLVLSATASFAAIDWWMSLEPTWFSTMYPPLMCTEALLLAFAFGIVVVTIIGGVGPKLLNDLGSLLLAFLMLWGYMTYFQYMLIWAGNLQDEITYFVRRAEGNWEPIAWSVAGLGFLLPFWMLLFRGLKRNRRWLAFIASWVLIIGVVGVYWLIQPSFTAEGPVVSWLQPVIWIGIGGLWLGTFVWALGRAPLIARNDPRMVPTLEEVARATA